MHATLQLIKKKQGGCYVSEGLNNAAFPRGHWQQFYRCIKLFSRFDMKMNASPAVMQDSLCEIVTLPRCIGYSTNRAVNDVHISYCLTIEGIEGEIGA
jgi:hypothetical protein